MTNVSLSITGAIARITLNNPSKHNAFDDLIIKDLRSFLNQVKSNNELRLLLLQAEGKNFSAGADLGWMKKMAKLSYEDNLEDAKNLAALMQELYDLPIPTIAKVHGAAFGGAIGLISCCDIAVASNNAKFCLSEVKLGLAPATIGPFVVKAIGARTAKKLFLTAEVFDAEQALKYGLIHEVSTQEELDTRIKGFISHILKTGPSASKAAKQLIKTIEENPHNLNDITSELIATLRVSKEGQAGLNAFFKKETPYWSET